MPGLEPVLNWGRFKKAVNLLLVLVVLFFHYQLGAIYARTGFESIIFQHESFLIELSNPGPNSVWIFGSNVDPVVKVTICENKVESKTVIFIRGVTRIIGKTSPGSKHFNSYLSQLLGFFQSSLSYFILFLIFDPCQKRRPSIWRGRFWRVFGSGTCQWSGLLLQQGQVQAK